MKEETKLWSCKCGGAYNYDGSKWLCERCFEEGVLDTCHLEEKSIKDNTLGNESIKKDDNLILSPSENTYDIGSNGAIKNRPITDLVSPSDKTWEEKPYNKELDDEVRDFVASLEGSSEEWKIYAVKKKIISATIKAKAQILEKMYSEVNTAIDKNKDPGIAVGYVMLSEFIKNWSGENGINLEEPNK